MTRAHLLAIPVLALILASSSAQATEVGSSRRFGLGVQIGDPTAITGKAFIGGGNAFDFGLGFGGWGSGWCYHRDGSRYRCYDRHGHLSLHADYLYQENIVNSQLKLDWHAGFGGRVIFWDYYHDGDDRHDLILLGRVPLGFDFAFRRPSFIEPFIEIAPALVVFPYLDIWFDVALGIRAFF
jgi:hypothetical protein